MPIKDPSTWQHLIELLARAFGNIFDSISKVSGGQTQGPHARALLASAVIAMVRALVTGQGGAVARLVKGAGDALMCGTMLLFVIPAVEWFDVPQDASVVAGGAIAFMGTDWVRKLIVAGANRVLDKVGPGAPLE